MRIIIDPPILAVIYGIPKEIFRISQQDFIGDFRMDFVRAYDFQPISVEISKLEISVLRMRCQPAAQAQLPG